MGLLATRNVPHVPSRMSYGMDRLFPGMDLVAMPIVHCLTVGEANTEVDLDVGAFLESTSEGCGSGGKCEKRWGRGD